MSARRRLDKLEGKAGPGFRPDPPTGYEGEGREVDAVREIDARIAELTAELEAEEARMSPAELAQSRLEWAAASAAREERMYGCSLDEQIADLQREIEEAERQEAEEEGGGWSLMAGCIGVKPNGELCKGVARRGSDWCPAHDPAQKEARRRNASKAARSKPGREIKDLKDQLADLAADVLGGITEPKIGAVVNQILNTRTRLLETERKIRETEELERRLGELEVFFEQQRDGQRGAGW